MYNLLKYLNEANEKFDLNFNDNGEGSNNDFNGNLRQSLNQVAFCYFQKL